MRDNGGPDSSDESSRELCSDPDCALRTDLAAHCWVEPVLHCHRPVSTPSFGDLYQQDCRGCHVLVNVRHRARGRRRSDAIAWYVMDRVGQEVVNSARSANDTQDLLGGVFRVLGDSVARADESESLAMLGQTAAQVLHGLRNSLEIIGGQARRVRDAARATPEVTESGRAILDEVAQLEEIVGSLLAEGALVGHRPEPVDPGELAVRAAKQEKGAFKRAGIVLHESRESDLPGIVVDPDRILLAVRTILQNARDATPRGGEVRLRTRRQDSCVVFEIEDSGPGMTDDRKGRACEPGYTTKGEGTGLGLWLARRVLRRHGGAVNLSDAAEGGLIVRLGVPIGK